MSSTLKQRQHIPEHSGQAPQCLSKRESQPQCQNYHRGGKQGSAPDEAVEPDPDRPGLVATAAQAAHGHIAVCDHVGPNAGQQS